VLQLIAIMRLVDRKFTVGLIRVFIFGFLGVFLPAIQGIYLMPNLDLVKAALLAALGGGIAAGVKAVVDFLTKGVTPVKSVGILPRNTAP
jgi:hypothetical protein